MIRPYVHIALHFLVPALVAGVFFRANFLRAWSSMCAAIIVDLDHLVADPVYDPGRCSIGFHPLHQYPVIAAYGLALLWTRIRLFVIGLLIHMGLDGVDCLWMNYENQATD